MRAVARHVPVRSRCADIGTDHARLPVILVRERRCSRVIATDRSPAPLRGARSRLRRERLDAVVELRRGPGLSTLRPGEVDVVCVAGLGGPEIARMLAGDPPALGDVRRLVLQPLGIAESVRRLLCRVGFLLVDEDLVCVGGRGYQVLVAERADGRDPEEPYRARPEAADIAWLVGPHLMRRRPRELCTPWRRRLAACEAALAELRARGARPARARLVDLERARERLRAVVRWLDRAGPSGAR